MTTDGIPDDMFAFEVPTPQGRARIILPEGLTHAEGKRLGEKLAAILDAMFLPSQDFGSTVKRFSNGNASTDSDGSPSAEDRGQRD